MPPQPTANTHLVLVEGNQSRPRSSQPRLGGPSQTHGTTTSTCRRPTASQRTRRRQKPQQRLRATHGGRQLRSPSNHSTSRPSIGSSNELLPLTPSPKIPTTHPLLHLHACGEGSKEHLRPPAARSSANHQIWPVLATQGLPKDQPIRPAETAMPPAPALRGQTPTRHATTVAPVPSDLFASVRRPPAHHLLSRELRSRRTAPDTQDATKRPRHRSHAVSPASVTHGQRWRKDPATIAPTGLGPSAPARSGGGEEVGWKAGG